MANLTKVTLTDGVPGDSGDVSTIDALLAVVPAALGSGGGLKVDGSGTALPVSAASLPLPTGAATAANQPDVGTAGTPSADVLSVQGVTDMTPLKVDGSGVTQPVSGTFWQTTQPVSGTFWQTTQPVSAASLPLPSGASTAAKQPALGTAGTASSDVLTVQGVASMTPVTTGGVTTNPTSVLTRPGDTNAYAVNDLIASSTTAGSVTVPSFTGTRVSAGAGWIERLRLYTNHTTGLDLVQVRVRLWTAAPTFSNGDNGAFAVATGAAGYLGRAEGILEQFGDGAVAILVPYTGQSFGIKLSSGTSVYWTLETLTAFTPASGKTFTLVPEIRQD
jgi:hypothetical protein